MPTRRYGIEEIQPDDTWALGPYNDFATREEAEAEIVAIQDENEFTGGLRVVPVSRPDFPLFVRRRAGQRRHIFLDISVIDSRYLTASARREAKRSYCGLVPAIPRSEPKKSGGKMCRRCRSRWEAVYKRMRKALGVEEGAP